MAELPADVETLEAYYFDASRTHEVLASVEKEVRGLRLVVVEMPFGVRDAREAVTRAERFEEPWEARLALREFETRLAASGQAYWRAVGGGAPEPLPRLAVRNLDFAPQRVDMPGDAKRGVLYQHFVSREGRSRLDLAVPRLDLPGERAVLARVDFAFPDVAGGDLAIVHPRLSPALLRQRWVEAAIDLPKSGFQRVKSVVDYAREFGPDWRLEWEGAWRQALQRLLRGDVTPARAEPKPVAPTREAVLSIDEAWRRPVLVAAASRHLQAGEGDALVRAGEMSIRRFVAERRRRSHPDAQVELSLVEAALLARFAKAKGLGLLAEEEGARLSRLVRDFERGQSRLRPGAASRGAA